MVWWRRPLWHMSVKSGTFGARCDNIRNEILTLSSPFSQASIRGILIAVSGIAATLGLFIVFLLGSITAWRDAAIYCLVVPIITMVAVCFVSVARLESNSYFYRISNWGFLSFFPDSGNTIMVAVEKSHRRGNEITAMVTWLGVAESCWKRIRWNRTLQRILKSVRWMCQSWTQMSPSATDNCSKTARIGTKAHTETVRRVTHRVFREPILGNASNATVYRVDSEPLRYTNQSKLGDCGIGCHRYRWNNYMCAHGEIDWETKTVHYIVDWSDFSWLCFK